MSESVATRLSQRLWSCVVVSILAVVLAGCGSDDSNSTPDAEGGYGVVIEWFVNHSGTTQGDRPLVFLQARGEGLSIGLEAQAKIVSAADGFADVRFVDDPAEALDVDGVRSGGIFLALGPAIVEGGVLAIECDRILSDAVTETWAFNLVARHGAWKLSGGPRQST